MRLPSTCTSHSPNCLPLPTEGWLRSSRRMSRNWATEHLGLLLLNLINLLTGKPYCVLVFQSLLLPTEASSTTTPICNATSPDRSFTVQEFWGQWADLTISGKMWETFSGNPLHVWESSWSCRRRLRLRENFQHREMTDCPLKWQVFVFPQTANQQNNVNWEADWHRPSQKCHNLSDRGNSTEMKVVSYSTKRLSEETMLQFLTNDTFLWLETTPSEHFQPKAETHRFDQDDRQTKQESQTMPKTCEKIKTVFGF